MVYQTGPSLFLPKGHYWMCLQLTMPDAHERLQIPYRDETLQLAMITMIIE